MLKSMQYTVQQLDAVVKLFSDQLQPGAIVTLAGLLGAGKTTFVQRLCAELGVAETVVSPTYSYVSVYALADMTIYHFDLYRISGIEEFESFGFADYLSDPRGIVLIEWPDRIASLLERPAYRARILALTFKYLAKNDGLRELHWAGHGDSDRLVGATVEE